MLKLKTHFTDDVWVVEKPFSIGSADDNQLIINDPTVDAHHARIVFDGKKHILRDLSAPNGTFVNGQRINQKPLQNGDDLRFGDFSLKVNDPLVAGNQEYWCLVACSSWLQGQNFPLPFDTQNPRIKIGRGDSCKVQFPGTHLAKEHVELELQEDHIFVRNLNSLGGIYINEKKMDSGPLYPGDKLRLDVYNFRLFGPNQLEDTSEDLERSLDALSEELDNGLDPLTDDNPKRWKMRPTSPGNRPGIEKKPAPAFEALALKLGAAAALLGFLLLAAYIWAG